MTNNEMTTEKINDYLKLISIFQYILAGFTFLTSFFPILHLGFGLFMLFAPEASLCEMAKDGCADVFLTRMMGVLFVCVGGGIMLSGFAFGGAILLTGRYIAQRRRPLFCMIVAGLECMFMPLGTALGVWTLFLLLKKEVSVLFAPSAE